jgi:hypothetical protein
MGRQQTFLLLELSTFWTVDKYDWFIAMRFLGACNIFFNLSIIVANKGGAIMNGKLILCLIGIVLVAFPLHAFGDGACCFPSGLCSISNDEFDCEEGPGNIWQGDDTVCQPNPCSQQQSTAVPTLSEWGKIAFMMLAGVGAAYYLRRKTKEES